MAGALVVTDWSSKVSSYDTQADATATGYFKANIGAIRAALSGLGPDDTPGSGTPAGIGACMVANISSAHIPAVCSASSRGDPKPYKNGYDLGKYHVGSGTPSGAWKLRELVDEALPRPSGATPADLYFGAMELNGTGVYFYGDVCLAIKTLPDDTILLASNSYDLVRAPLKGRIEDGYDPLDWPQRRTDEAQRMSGVWRDDRDLIAVDKVFGTVGVHSRRLTTGQISDALRVDEDYVEILKIGSFGTGNLSEARFSAADAACEAFIADRMRAGPVPPLTSEIWRDKRRVAERELRARGVFARVITTSGRVKG
jgi:hypothetical protein